MPYRILFVCMGGLCRSPALKSIFDCKAKELKLDGVVYANGAAADGEAQSSLDPRMVNAAARRGYEIPEKSRPFVESDFAQYDLILVMNRELKRDIAARPNGREQQNKIRVFGEYAPSLQGADLFDPYEAPSEKYDLALDLMEEGCTALLKELGEKFGSLESAPK